MVGYRIGHPAKQELSTQAVIDALAKPLPIPKGARQLPKIVIPGRPDGQGRAEGRITWVKGVLLDVTGMDPNDVEAIPAIYGSHFGRELPLGGYYSSGPNNYKLLRVGPDDFKMYSFVTLHRIERYSGPGANAAHFDLDLTIDFHVMDFDRSLQDDAHRFEPLEVQFFDSPVRRQRVMWLVFSFKATGLTGTGKWPE
jgi:hypothetical protein